MILRLNDVSRLPKPAVLKTLTEGRLWDEQPVPCAVHLPASGTSTEYSNPVPHQNTFGSPGLEARQDVRFGFCDSRNWARLLPALFDLTPADGTRTAGRECSAGIESAGFMLPFRPRSKSQVSSRELARAEWTHPRMSCGFVHGSTYLHLQEGCSRPPNTGTLAWVCGRGRFASSCGPGSRMRFSRRRGSP